MNYLPPVRCKSDYDGFYVDNSAIYASGDEEKDWNEFQQKVVCGIRNGHSLFKAAFYWKPTDDGHSLYTLAESSMYDIIVETEDGYTAVFLIISRNCKNQNTARKSLPRYTEYLKRVLLNLYPSHVRKRINDRKTKLVG